MEDKYFHLVGWLLFIVCSLLYIYDSFNAGNIVSFIGGIAFFLGCIVFIIPIIKDWEKGDK